MDLDCVVISGPGFYLNLKWENNPTNFTNPCPQGNAQNIPRKKLFCSLDLGFSILVISILVELKFVASRRTLLPTKISAFSLCRGALKYPEVILPHF